MKGLSSGSKMFDTLIVFLKEFFKNVDFEKNQQMTKKHENYPESKELTLLHAFCRLLIRFKNELFKKITSTCGHLSVKLFGSRSGCLIWVKTVCKG